MDKLKINTEFIKLDQLLKWAGITGSGVEAKELIISGKVMVNGELELRRGRKIRPGDRVDAVGKSIVIE